jgi:hypothetical protein
MLLMPPTSPLPPGLFRAAAKAVGAAAGLAGSAGADAVLTALFVLESAHARNIVKEYAEDELYERSLMTHDPFAVSAASGQSPVAPVEGTKPALSPATKLICQDTKEHELEASAVQDSFNVDTLGVSGTTELICGTAEGTISAVCTLAALTGLVRTLSVHTRLMLNAYLYPDAEPATASCKPVAVHDVVLAVVRPEQPVGTVPTRPEGVAVVKVTCHDECTHELMAPGVHENTIVVVEGLPGTGVDVADTAAGFAV